MLRRCPVALWVPRYFGGRTAAAAKGPRRGKPFASASTSTAPSASAASASASSASAASAASPLARRGHAQRAALVPSAAVAVRASALLDRLRKAEDAFVANRRIGFSPVVDSLEPREGIYFVGKTEVLSVLKKILAPASPRIVREGVSDDKNLAAAHSFMERSKESKRKLIPIPDEAVNDATKYVRQLRMPTAEAGPSISDRPDHKGFVALSMNDLAIILQFYEAVECEDGALLLQLMAELERLVINNNEANSEESVAAVPQILLAMSGLGIVEEHVLQKLTNTKGEFCSPAKLSRLSESELVRFVVAFHRFGLHNQVCFRAIVKILRHRVERNSIKSFVRQTLFTETADVVPECIVGLTVNNVLEALSAMALSQHRDSGVVNFLVAIVVGAIVNENPDLCSPDDYRFRTLQVHQAAKICELMELEQLILANLIHTRSTMYGGLFVDGGEDQIDAERMGFYDYVTADLVKANRG